MCNHPCLRMDLEGVCCICASPTYLCALCHERCEQDHSNGSNWSLWGPIQFISPQNAAREQVQQQTGKNTECLHYWWQLYVHTLEKNRYELVCLGCHQELKLYGEEWLQDLQTQLSHQT